MAIESKFENITPDIAAKYLETMDGNRTVRQTRIDAYAAQMKSGLWRKTHQGIAFDADGHLIDGQHRMWSIIESGVTVAMMVSRGVNPEDVVAVDSGLGRSYADVGLYAGWENADPVAAAIAKAIVTGVGNMTKAIPAEIMQRWYQHYSEGADFGVRVRNMTRGAGTKTITVPCAVAFARASYTQDKTMLIRMAEILRTGIISVDADKAALALRDAWLTKRLGVNSLEQYYKASSAIRAFLQRRPIRTLQRVESDLYEVPKLPPELRFSIVARRITRTRHAEMQARPSANPKH
jgi:hypothetical protein